MPSNSIKIKVIKPGILVRSETGVILDARSTVTLIKSEKSNILIDTSLKKDKDSLTDSLNKENLSLEDINIIINTHCHRDHIGNNEIFPNARIVTHYSCPIINTDKIKDFPYKLERGIELIETVGHSWDSLTVIVKIDKNYAITGDAIPIKGNYDNWIPPIVHVDAKKALDSMEKIVKIADIIIPGHDSPFTIQK